MANLRHMSTRRIPMQTFDRVLHIVIALGVIVFITAVVIQSKSAPPPPPPFVEREMTYVGGCTNTCQHNGCR